MKKRSTLPALTGLILLSFLAAQAQSNVHDYEIRFPKDAQANCTLPVPDTILVEETGACDLLAVSVEDAFFAASGDECYKIFRTYRVLNWCEYDGQAPPVIVSRDEDCDGSPGEEHVWVLVRPNGVSYFDRDNNEGNNNPAAFTKLTACDGLSNPAGHWVNSVAKPSIASRGYWQYTQHIKVYDNVDPAIAVLPYDPFCSYDSPSTSDPVCNGPVSFGFNVSELCTPGDVTIKVFLDAFNDGAFPYDYNVRLDPDGTLTGSTHVFSIGGAYPNYTISSVGQGLPIGTHKFEIHAEDGCRNVSAVDAIVEVRDCKAPTPVCYNGLTLTLMPVDNDNDGLPENGMAEVWASDFIASPVVDCSLPVSYSLRRPGQAPDIDRISLVFTCSDYQVGGGSTGTPYLVYVDAWDAAGNMDFCETYILLQDQSAVCPGPAVPATISGFIRTETGDPVPGINLSLNGGMSQTTHTEADGFYRFDDIPMWNDYSWYPACVENYAAGVTTLDVILIQRHILAVQPLGSPYRIIAADANNSGSVTLLDVIWLNRLILGVIDALPYSDSWRFIPAGYAFPVPENPWFEQFPEILSVQNCPVEVANQDFVGVKVGDVNNSSLEELLALEDRHIPLDALPIQLDDREVKSGELIAVDFRCSDLGAVRGFQFSLGFNPSFLSFASIEYNVLTEANFGAHSASRGVIAVNWIEEIPAKDYPADEVLFRLVFSAGGDGRLSDMLGINNELLRSEAYNLNLERMGVALKFNGGTVAPDRFEVYQNFPNPCRDFTTISFYLPERSRITLEVRDVQGRLLQTRTGNFDQGYAAINLDARSLPSGVCQYTLSTEKYSVTKKMIVLDRE